MDRIEEDAFLIVLARELTSYSWGQSLEDLVSVRSDRASASEIDSFMNPARFHANLVTLQLRLVTMVGSTGGGNTCLKLLGGSLVFERFPWSFAELLGNGTQFGLVRYGPAALAVLDPDQHALAIDIIDLEVRDL